MPVSAALDLPDAVPPDRIDPRPSGEDPYVEQHIGFEGIEKRWLDLQRDDAGDGAFGQTGLAKAERGRSAGKGRVEKRSSGRATGLREHVAGPRNQALIAFELAKLVGETDQDVRIRAYPEVAARLAPRDSREEAVAEAGFRDRTAVAPLRARPEVSGVVMWVAWMAHQR